MKKKHGVVWRLFISLGVLVGIGATVAVLDAAIVGVIIPYWVGGLLPGLNEGITSRFWDKTGQWFLGVMVSMLTLIFLVGWGYILNALVGWVQDWVKWLQKGDE